MSEKKDLLSIYALVGSDKLRINKVLDRLNIRLEEYGDMSFDSVTFDCDNACGADIVQACSIMPFTAKKRYVLAKNAESLKKEDSEAIIEYLSNPIDTAILVLVFSKLAKNTRLYKAISKYNSTSIIDCTPPKKYKMVETLNTIARSYGASINFDAAKKLVELIGEDTLRLDGEIKKLLTLNGNNTITYEIVAMNVANSSDVKPWDFTNAFAAKNLDKCIQLLQKMPEGSEYVLLPQVCKLVKEFICVKDLGVSANQYSIAKTLGCEPWRVKNHVVWARNFSTKKLIDILDAALDCEVQIKSTSDSKKAFEIFVVESLR